MTVFMSFAVALQFLTMIPIHLKQLPTPAQLGRSLLFYPLVGLLIGIVLAGASWLFDSLSVPVVAALILVLWVGITGALHLDGLADCADAWVGGLGDREKTLAIMKDPACGPVAVSVLLLALLMKFVLLAEVISGHNVMVIVLATTLSRTALPLLFLTTPYVRANGIGSVLVANQPVKQSKWLILAVTILSLVLFPWLVLISTLVVFLLLRYWMLKRLDGATGDTAGALVELLEIWILFSSLIFA